MQKKIMKGRVVLAFAVTIILIAVLFLWAVNTGGLQATFGQLFRGLFLEQDETVDIIVQLRFPRIVAALLGGALMAVSGALMQAVMKNPLADPGIIGITSGATLSSLLVLAFLPSLAGLFPLFSFAGGMMAFILVYILASDRRSSASPVRLILVGIAVDALLSGLSDAFSAGTGGTYSGAASVVNSNISLKTWDDVKLLAIYALISAVCCLFIAGKCNLLAFSDQTLHSLGVNIGRLRIIISMVSVLMASIFTAVIGSISFLGLIVPHIARLLVGSDSKVLIPYSACLGAAILLLADTVGRSIAYPYEISSTIIMAVIGGPMFIILLKRSRKVYG